MDNKIDEGILGYMLNMGMAVDDCLNATESNQRCLIKQIKINKNQKVLNIILSGLVVLCIKNIDILIKTVKNQNIRIKKLEAEINVEEKKGE